jgi:paraquat-inducible protein A
VFRQFAGYKERPRKARKFRKNYDIPNGHLLQREITLGTGLRYPGMTWKRADLRGHTAISSEAGCSTEKLIPMGKNTKDGAWLSCPECEAVSRDRVLPPGAELRCRPCGARIKKQHGPNALQTVWALATAGLILVVLANVEPVLTFEVAGNAKSNLIVSGVIGLIAQGYWPVGVLVFFGAIAGPALHLIAVWYVAGACCLGRPWPKLVNVSRMVERLEPWNLIAVFAVANMVAVVKLDMLGKVEWRQGVFWVVALSLCSLVTVQMFDSRLVEKRLEELA